MSQRLNRKRALIIDDERLALEFYSEVLEAQDLAVTKFTCPKTLLNELNGNFSNFDLILIDYNLPDMLGVDLLKTIKQYTNVPKLIFTSESNMAQAIEAMRLGAFDYIEKNFSDTNSLTVAIQRALTHRNLQVENSQLKKQINNESTHSFTLNSNNEFMSKIIYTLEKVSPTKASVLITGARGTGKDYLANFIHQNSLNANGPFVKINCSATPQNIISQDFNIDNPQNIFNRASNGTLYIDEIADLSSENQRQLLMSLEKLSEAYNVRIISSSHDKLLPKVKANIFKEELFYKLSIVNIDLPKLKDRKEDLHQLTTFFLNHFTNKHQKIIQSLDESAVKILLNSSFEGNIRELENMLERAVIMCEGSRITSTHFITNISTNSASDIFNPHFIPDLNLKQIEKEYTKFVINHCQGNLLKAAKILEVSKRTIYRKIQDEAAMNAPITQ